MTPDHWAILIIVLWIAVGLYGVFSDRDDEGADQFTKHWEPDLVDIVLVLCIFVLSVLIAPIIMVMDFFVRKEE